MSKYLLGVFEPVETYIGKCIAVIHRTNDDDDKLIVVPKGKYYTDELFSRTKCLHVHLIDYIIYYILMKTLQFYKC